LFPRTDSFMLTQFSDRINSQADFIDFIRSNSVNGRNLSIRGLAELCGVAESSLREGARIESSKLAQKLTSSGFEGARIEETGFCAQSAWLVIEYFSYESKAKAPGAKRLARLFGSIGVQACFDMSNQQTVAEPVVSTQRQLAPQRDLLDYIEAAKSIGIDRDPLLLSLFSQRMAEQLGGGVVCAQTQAIVTVRAQELGYSAKEIGSGSALGRFVKQQGCKPTGVTKHGKYDVNVYDLTDELDRAIQLFFS
jgi:hypothetical protein